MRFSYPSNPSERLMAIPVDPAGGYCYRSNMWLTYPMDGDNLANVRLIPNRKEVLEMSSF